MDNSYNLKERTPFTSVNTNEGILYNSYTDNTNISNEYKYNDDMSITFGSINMNSFGTNTNQNIEPFYRGRYDPRYPLGNSNDNINELDNLQDGIVVSDNSLKEYAKFNSDNNNCDELPLDKPFNSSLHILSPPPSAGHLFNQQLPYSEFDYNQDNMYQQQQQPPPEPPPIPKIRKEKNDVKESPLESYTADLFESIEERLNAINADNKVDDDADDFDEKKVPPQKIIDKYLDIEKQNVFCLECKKDISIVNCFLYSSGYLCLKCASKNKKLNRKEITDWETVLGKGFGRRCERLKHYKPATSFVKQDKSGKYKFTKLCIYCRNVKKWEYNIKKVNPE